MYYKMMLEDKVRVPPTRLGEKLDKVLLDVLQEHLEGSIDKELGIFIAVTRVEHVGEEATCPAMAACITMSSLRGSSFGSPCRKSSRALSWRPRTRGICEPWANRCHAACKPNLGRVNQFR